MKLLICKRNSTILRVIQINADGEELDLVEDVDYEIEDDYDEEPDDDWGITFGDGDTTDLDEDLEDYFDWLDDDEKDFE